MSTITPNLAMPGATASQAAQLYDTHRLSIYRRTDRVFAILMTVDQYDRGPRSSARGCGPRVLDSLRSVSARRNEFVVKRGLDGLSANGTGGRTTYYNRA